MSGHSKYSKFLHNYPIEQNENAIIHSLLILNKLSKSMRMKSKRLIHSANKEHKRGLIPRAVTWEYAAQLIEDEMRALNGRIRRISTGS